LDAEGVVPRARLNTADGKTTEWKSRSSNADTPDIIRAWPEHPLRRASRGVQLRGQTHCAGAKLKPKIHGTAQEDVVHQSSVYAPPQQLLDRPNCSKCGTKMWLTRVEPPDKPDHDVRTFECPECDHSETVVVKFR